MKATGTVVIDAPVERIWDFVMDTKRYPLADTKILEYEILEEKDGELVARNSGYMRWRLFRGENILKITPRPYERIDLVTVPGSLKFPASAFEERFQASFTFEPAEGGTRVTHTEEVVFKPNPAGRLLERLFSDWLMNHLQGEEMPRLKQLVEAEPA